MVIKCQENNIKHRFTASFTPKTNGKNAQEMKQHLAKFISFNNLYKRHRSLIKKFNVKTAFQDTEKMV